MPATKKRRGPSASQAAGEKETMAGPTTEPTKGVKEAEQIAPVGHNEIARLAYSYWEARGHLQGSPEEDWFRAEQALQVTRLATKVGRA